MLGGQGGVGLMAPHLLDMAFKELSLPMYCASRDRRSRSGFLSSLCQAARSGHMHPAPVPPPTVRRPQVVVGKQQDKTSNAFVGGANRWQYTSFVNW